MVFRNQDLAGWCVHCYWPVTASEPSQWIVLGSICTCANSYLHTISVSVCVNTHTHARAHTCYAIYMNETRVHTCFQFQASTTKLILAFSISFFFFHPQWGTRSSSTMHLRICSTPVFISEPVPEILTHPRRTDLSCSAVFVCSSFCL